MGNEKGSIEKIWANYNFTESKTSCNHASPPFGMTGDPAHYINELMGCEKSNAVGGKWERQPQGQMIFKGGGGSDGLFDSSIFMAGNSFEFTFNDPGTYDYFCMVHPWMTGIINVG